LHVKWDDISLSIENVYRGYKPKNFLQNL